MEKDGFSMIPNWFFDDGHMTAMGVNTFTVYMLLVRHANYQSKECNPSYSSIQKKARIGRTAISSAINYLTQYGYIQVLKTGNATQSSSTYKVLPFSQIKGTNQSHIGLVLNRTSPKDRSQLVPYGTATSPNQDCELVPYGTLNIQTLKRQIEKDKEEKDAEIFSLDSANQNQAMQEVKTFSDGIADQEDPTPLPPAPLSEAAIALKAKFEGRFDRKTKAQWWERYVKHDDDAWRELLTDWAFSETNAANFKESLLIVQIDHLRKIPSPCERGNAINSLSNYIRHDDLVSFQTRVDAAIAYEKALAANPTLQQSQDTETQQEPYMPKVGEVDANGMVLLVDCRWEHYYPMKARFSKQTGNAEIVWGMINTRPPDPVDERCQRFLAKVKEDPERLAKLLTAKHLADSDFASYRIQAENFVNAKDGLIAALNQEIEKLLAHAA